MVLSDGRSVDGSHADALTQGNSLEPAGDNPEDTEAQLREALRSLEHASAPDDPALSRPLRDLAQVLIELGSFEEAEGLLTRAVDLCKRADGTSDDELASLLGALSRLYVMRSAYDLAEPPLVRLLAMAEAEAQGEDRPEVAAALTSLAAVRHALGEYTSAETLYRRALRIDEGTLPPDHPSTIATLESLAETCAARGRIDEAVSLYDRALSMREKSLGPDDASVKVTLARISDLQLEAQEDSRFATPPRSAPALRPSPAAEASLAGRTSGAGASPVPIVLIPDWRSPGADDDRTPVPGSSSKATVVMAGVVLLLAGAGVAWQLRDRQDQYELVVVQPRVDSIAPARDSTATAAAPRGATSTVVERERARPQAPPSRVVVAPPRTRERTTASSAQRADAATTPGALPPRATNIVDSAARAAPRAIEPPPAPAPGATTRASTAPTSPTLIGPAPQPQYPAALRDQRIEGDVVVQFVVDETGRPDVSSTTVVRSPHVLLTNAVLAILPQFRFEPARTAPPQSIPRPETVRRVFTFRAPRP